MDLVSWSLNTIDQIFLTRRQGTGEPSYPDGALAAGYMMDFWNKWKVLCLASLYIEDTEDVYIFRFLVTGFLLFGVSGYLVYRQIQKMSEAIQVFIKLPFMCEGMSRAVKTQTAAFGELNCGEDS